MTRLSQRLDELEHEWVPLRDEDQEVCFDPTVARALVQVVRAAEAYQAVLTAGRSGSTFTERQDLSAALRNALANLSDVLTGDPK
jgi:hypothetical protein